jgi:hypothetical protein
VDEKIIDFQRYLGGVTDARDAGTFSVWGGKGARARFALPVWRSVFLLDAERGGIVQLPVGADEPRPFFFLDLVQEPARVECAATTLRALRDEDVPALIFHSSGDLAVLLLARNAD